MKHLTVVYDGYCRLCAWGIGQILSCIPPERIDYIPAQSPEGSAALRRADLDNLDLQSVLVLKEGQPLTESAAILAVCDEAGGIWRYAAFLYRLLPICVRNFLYRRIAANRYKWFGRRDQCFVPPRLNGK